MKITIIIPTYNEGEAIGNLLDAVIAETKEIKNHIFSILIVDGNSKDNTQENVKNKSNKYDNIKLIVEKSKSGLGNAYLEGMNYAINNLGADAFMEFDGDFQHNPKDIKKLVEKLDQGYEYIIGSRYIKGGTIPREWPWYRKAISSFGNIVISVGLRLGINDATSGFKLSTVDKFKDSMPLKQGQLISLRHAYKIHFLYNMIKAGAKTVEVPIEFLNRNKGISKSTFEDIIESLRVVFVLIIKGGNNRIVFKNKP
jgi:dolichol-phosphate mannosyltransferase